MPRACPSFTSLAGHFSTLGINGGFRMPSSIGMTRGTELAGKVALVTGSARNIGRAIARALAAGGAAVMVNANTSRAEAEQTVAMIRAAGGRAALQPADVTDPDAVGAL